MRQVQNTGINLVEYPLDFSQQPEPLLASIGTLASPPNTRPTGPDAVRPAPSHSRFGASPAVFC